MNPLILIGLDLTVSAVLIVMAMFVVWSRLRSHLDGHGRGGGDPGVSKETEGNRTDTNSAAWVSQGAWEFGEITEKAADLKQKGCSMEQIAQRLQLPTREVEMLLAISEMALPESSARGCSVSFPLEPEAVRMG